MRPWSGSRRLPSHSPTGRGPGPVVGGPCTWAMSASSTLSSPTPPWTRSSGPRTTTRASPPSTVPTRPPWCCRGRCRAAGSSWSAASWAGPGSRCTTACWMRIPASPMPYGPGRRWPRCSSGPGCPSYPGGAPGRSGGCRAGRGGPGSCATSRSPRRTPSSGGSWRTAGIPGSCSPGSGGPTGGGRRPGCWRPGPGRARAPF